MKNDTITNDILKQLTRIADAFDTLNVMYGLNDTPATTVEHNIEPETIEPVDVPAPTAPTHDDLKAACLSAVRDDVGNKSKLKSLLSEYGANKAVDVPGDKLAEVIAKINAGEY